MRAIFGLAVDEDRTITLTGEPRYSGAHVDVGTRDGSSINWDEVPAASSTTWTLALDPGDYIVTVDDDEAYGPITITTDEDVTLVTIPATGTPEAKPGLLSKYASVTAGNPKDPWPPPSATNVTLGTSRLAWFESELSTYYSESRSVEGGGRPRAEDDAA